jgi:acyl-coenzyme A synthetase/AMP-(fatty) acid ligase
MLQRMINQNPTALASLDCIISGGAPLNPVLVEETFNKLGDKLFNLYGTSEAGLAMIATPADLRYDCNTIGKKIAGVKLSLLDFNNKEVRDGAIGRICIKSKWSTNNTDNGWIKTGDLAYRDKLGYYFLCGRTDEMIVSGGENVYPIELENILIKHPEIKQVAVIGVPDIEFGQRLKAFVVPIPGSTIDEEEIFNWLSKRVARFQMPASLIFLKDLPLTSLGKLNKKLLS